MAVKGIEPLTYMWRSITLPTKPLGRLDTKCNPLVILASLRSWRPVDRLGGTYYIWYSIRHECNTRTPGGVQYTITLMAVLHSRQNKWTPVDMQTKNTIGEILEATLVPLNRSSFPLSPNPDAHRPPKKEQLNQKVHLQILCLSGGLKLPNPNQGNREAARHLFLRQIPQIDSWHKVDSGRYNIHLVMPALTLLSKLGRYFWFETVTAPGHIVY